MVKVKYSQLVSIVMTKSTAESKKTYIDSILTDLADVYFRTNVDHFPHQEDIRNFYQQGDITDEQIENALEQAVRSQARDDFDYLTNSSAPAQRYPDHLSGTEPMFAHAIEHGVFTGEELGEIQFDHGGIMSYGREYFNPDLISKLKEKLLGDEILGKS